MRNPLIDEVRRIRAKMDREWARNPGRDEVAESRALLEKVCDVIVSENGERRYITNATKMLDVLIAPRLAKKKRSHRSATQTAAIESSPRD
jgi:hypothetical protein